MIYFVVSIQIFFLRWYSKKNYIFPCIICDVKDTSYLYTTFEKLNTINISILSSSLFQSYIISDFFDNISYKTILKITGKLYFVTIYYPNVKNCGKLHTLLSVTIIAVSKKEIKLLYVYNKSFLNFYIHSNM